MTNISRQPRTSGSALFSLIIVGSVVCLLASVVVPYYLVVDAHTEAQDRQRAREIASVCTAAQDAGLNQIQQQGLESTIRTVVRGGKAADRMFFVPGMTETDIPRVAKHLKISQGKLMCADPQGNRAVQ